MSVLDTGIRRIDPDPPLALAIVAQARDGWRERRDAALDHLGDFRRYPPPFFLTYSPREPSHVLRHCRNHGHSRNFRNVAAFPLG